jgi:hypothetical protein
MGSIDQRFPKTALLTVIADPGGNDRLSNID